MTQFDQYVFILCLIVFVMLTALLGVLIGNLLKVIIELIRSGIKDKEIVEEYRKELQEKKHGSRTWSVLSFIASAVVCIVLCGAFLFALTLNVTENSFNGSGIPSLKVVKSESMSVKHKSNGYLNTNDLNDQIQMFDLIVTDPLPDEFDLKLWDIVLYERDDDLIIHRIVGIEEPNEKHPDKRYFTFQGDASKYKDEFPVTYDMMRAAYSGTRIPFIGSFVMFMQSPAGWLCFLLILFTIIITPIIERKLLKEKEKRLHAWCEQKKKNPPHVRLHTVPLQLTRVHLEVGVRREKPSVVFQYERKKANLKARVRWEGGEKQ